MTPSQDSRDASESREKDIHELRQAAQRAHRLSSLLLPLLFASVITLGLTFGVRYHRKDLAATAAPPAASLQERIQPLREVFGKVTNTFVGPERSIPNEQAEAALLELRKLSFFVELQSADQIFEQMKQTVMSWNAQKQQTLTSDAGRRIASQEEIERFICRFYSPTQKLLTNGTSR